MRREARKSGRAEGEVLGSDSRLAYSERELERKIRLVLAGRMLHELENLPVWVNPLHNCDIVLFFGK